MNQELAGTIYFNFQSAMLIVFKYWWDNKNGLVEECAAFF